MCVSFETLNTNGADTHSQILTLLSDAGYPHLVSIPGTVLLFLRQMARSPFTVRRSVRQIGNECSKHNKTHLIRRLHEQWRGGVFWNVSLFHHILYNTVVHRWELKLNVREQKGTLWNPGQKFLKDIKLFKMNRVLPTQVFACLGFCLLFVCLVWLAQRFT